jgi:hypothetical protein
MVITSSRCSPQHPQSPDNLDPRFILNAARGDTTRHRKRRNIARGHGIGRKQSAASDYDTLRDRRMGRDP